MPRYLTQHTLACLTRQGAEALAQRMQAGGPAHAERVLVNMLEGKMFVEFRADSREVHGLLADVYWDMNLWSARNMLNVALPGYLAIGT